MSKRCLLCGIPAIVLLKPKVDGIELTSWDPMCLSCAERAVRHWTKHNVTWRRKSLPMASKSASSSSEGRAP